MYVACGLDSLQPILTDLETRECSTARGYSNHCVATWPESVYRASLVVARRVRIQTISYINRMDERACLNCAAQLLWVQLLQHDDAADAAAAHPRPAAAAGVETPEPLQHRSQQCQSDLEVVLESTTPRPLRTLTWLTSPANCLPFVQPPTPLHPHPRSPNHTQGVHNHLYFQTYDALWLRQSTRTVTCSNLRVKTFGVRSCSPSSAAP